MGVTSMLEARTKELRSQLDKRGIPWRGQGTKSTIVTLPNGAKLDYQTGLYGIVVKFHAASIEQAIDAMIGTKTKNDRGDTVDGHDAIRQEKRPHRTANS